MRFRSRRSGYRMAALGAGVLGVGLYCASLSGQGQLTEPVYRVSSDTAATTTAQPAAAQPAAAQPAPATQADQTPRRPLFELTQQPGEHPLAPAIRACKATLEFMDKNVPDYTCVLVKQERLSGELGEAQYINMRVKHEPFSVYMSFLKPHAGREVLYVNGKNDNELVVREAGFLGSAVGKINLHPESSTAMSEQKYPITKVGIRNLLLELIKNLEADTKFAESEVTTNPKAEVNKRSATLIQVKHPVPRQNFRSHIARIYFDNELRVPIYYDAYLWPAKEGEAPPLEESYAYTKLKLNNGYTARDFDAANGDIFK